MSWVLAVGDPAPALRPRRELTQASGRRLTARLDAAWDMQISMSGGAAPWAVDHEAREIVSMATDLHAWRDDDLIFRGRLAGRSGSGDESKRSVQWSAVDYRNLLGRRQVGAAGRAFTSTAQQTIGMTLIDESEALSGGNWGVTAGANIGTPTTRDATYDPGKPIGEAITQLGQLDGGFEWDLTPDATGALKFNVWHGSGRGADNGVVLDYGGLISGFSDSLDPGDFANAVLVTGSQDLTPVAAASGTIGTDPRGRWEKSFGFPSIVDQSTLNARAPYMLAQSSVLRPDLTVKLTPGTWQGRSHIWLGDIVFIVIQCGDLNVAADHRVTEVSLSIGDNDEEDVSLAMEAVV